MKLVMAILCGSILAASGQNFLIKFWPNNEPFAGLTNYPAQMQTVAFATNAPGWNTNMTAAQLSAHLEPLMPIYRAGESNAAYLAKQATATDIAQLVTAYSNLQWVADNFAAVTNVANLRIAVKACGDTLLKLKPVLVEMYQARQTP